MKVMITYLQPDFIGDLVLDKGFTETDRFKAIKGHPEVEYYTPEDFALAFNEERISDQGYIGIDLQPDDVSEHLDRKWVKGLPTEPGQYWFYGYRYGVISVGQ